MFLLLLLEFLLLLNPFSVYHIERVLLLYVTSFHVHIVDVFVVVTRILYHTPVLRDRGAQL